MQSNLEACLPEYIEQYNLKCKECNTYIALHDFSGRYDYAAGRGYVYNMPCAALAARSRVLKPNFIYHNKKWYFFGHRAELIPFLVKFEIGINIDSVLSINPRPTHIETYGDIYNFCSQNNVLDKLQMLVPEKVFKSMQGKSIERALKKMNG